MFVSGFLFRRRSRCLEVSNGLAGGRDSSYQISLEGVGLSCMLSVIRFSSMRFNKLMAKGIRLGDIVGGPIVQAHLGIRGFYLGHSLLKRTSVTNM